MGETKTLVVEHVNKYAFVAKGESNHFVVIDSEYDGRPAGVAGPMKMILAAPRSWIGSDVVEILRKKRQPVQRFTVSLDGERVEEHPRSTRRFG